MTSTNSVEPLSFDGIGKMIAFRRRVSNIARSNLAAFPTRRLYTSPPTPPIRRIRIDGVVTPMQIDGAAVGARTAVSPEGESGYMST